MALLDAARKTLVLVDDGQRIFDEYRRHLSHSGQPGLGDAFFKWLWDRQADTRHCRQIAITPIKGSKTDFAEYPADEALSKFDPSDRKFIAVALASGLNPEVLQATDSKWWLHRRALERHGVNVVFLCPDLVCESGKKK